MDKSLFLDFSKLSGLSFRILAARQYPEKLSKNKKLLKIESSL
jgi:hypothetical protein